MIYDLVIVAVIGCGLIYLASRSPLLATSIKLAVLGTWGAFTFVAPVLVIAFVYWPEQRVGAIAGTLAITAFLAVLWIASCPAEIRKTLANRDNFAPWH